jgi:hypothetical protein
MVAMFVSRLVDFGHRPPVRDFFIRVDLSDLFGHPAYGFTITGDAYVADFPIHCRFDGGVHTAIPRENFSLCHGDTPKEILPILSNLS